MVNYSKELTKMVKSYFGRESHAYFLCSAGEESLGVILTIELNKGISYKKLFNAESLEALQDYVELRFSLYDHWLEDMKKAYKDEEGLKNFLKARNMYVDTALLRSESGIVPNV